MHDIDRIMQLVQAHDMPIEKRESLLNHLMADNDIERMHELGGNTTDDVTNEWLETYSGAQIYPLREDIGDITMEDIAVSLSRTPRYNGHTDHVLYTAQHCCLMADYVQAEGGTKEECYLALHHDDGEAVVGDLVRPVKRLLPPFKVVEDGVFASMAEKFGYSSTIPPWLKDIDSRILVDEKKALRRRSPNVWAIDGLKPLGVQIDPWDSGQAYAGFMHRHHALKP